jgi:predicted restriction endonuclease
LTTQSKWLSKLAKLRVNRSQGLAPHKPLLLLVVLEMIEQGDLASPILKLSPELAYRFRQFGTVVAHRRTQRIDIRLPFFHLSSDGVWSAFTKEGDASYQTGRDVRFRLDIVAAYGYTCALTGYRVTTIGGSSIIDAAHIHQFSESRNNDPKNGIALCKNAHWMFDQGLWSLDDNYRVLVAHDAFDEDSPGQRSLRDFEGMRVSLPVNSNLWPDPQHLAWHREHKFCA